MPQATPFEKHLAISAKPNLIDFQDVVLASRAKHNASAAQSSPKSNTSTARLDRVGETDALRPPFGRMLQFVLST
jgi:hypothetical protein